jgi:hypothetical protein
MMRCTAFPAAVVVWMLGSGAIRERGTLNQELVVPTIPFLESLRARGLGIEETREV